MTTRRTGTSWAARVKAAAACALVALVASSVAVAPAVAGSSAIPTVAITQSGATPSAGAGDAGHLVLVGGALNENERILRKFVALADPDGDGPLVAHIAIVTAGSYPAQDEEEAADPEQDNAAANGIYYADLFAEYGATSVRVPIDESVDYEGDPYVPDNADDLRVSQSVHESTGVWFGGGDQMRYVRTLFDCETEPHEAFTSCADTVVMTAIRAVLEDGGVVGGTSAGLTIQQGADMVTGGQPYEAWRDGATPGYFEGRRLGYVPYGGFGFFEWGMLDSHFATWSRQPRMARLALDPAVDEQRIVGLDETTALVVNRATAQGKVIGRNGASVLDLSDAVLTDPDTSAASVTGVRWSYLDRGDRVDLETWAVTRAKGSVDVVGAGPKPPRVKDVWDTIEDDHTYSLRDLGVDVVQSAATKAKGVTYEDDPRYRTTVVVDGETSAWLTPHNDVSFDRLEVRIAPCCGAAPVMRP